MRYNPLLPLILTMDANKIGLDTILSHRLSNGQECRIAYASHTLSSIEQRSLFNNPHIDEKT